MVLSLMTPDNTHEDGVLSLKPSNTPTYSLDHSNDLATKAHIALGDRSPGINILTSSIRTGQEEQYRRALATQKTLDAFDVRSSVLTEIAQARGGNPTPEDIQIVEALSLTQLKSPDLSTILEEEYAHKAVEAGMVAVNEDTGILSDAMDSAPGPTMDVLQGAAKVVAAQQLISDQIDSVNQEISDSGWFGQTLNAVRPFIPLLSDAATSTIPQVGFGFAGENIQKFKDFFWGLDAPQMKQTLTQLRAHFSNYGDQAGYLRVLDALTNYSYIDRTWNNMWQGVDVASILPVAKVAKALRGVTKAAVTAVRDPVVAAERLGKSRLAAAKIIEEEAGLEPGAIRPLAGNDPKELLNNERLIPTMARVSESVGAAAKMAPAVLGRLKTSIEARNTLLQKAFVDVNRVSTLDASTTVNAFKAEEEISRDLFSHDKYSIVDIQRRYADNTTNLNSIVVRLGRKDGEFFTSEKEAIQAAKRIVAKKTDDWKPVPLEEGGRWTIEIPRNVREDGRVLDPIETKSKAPDSGLNTTFIGALRSPQYLLPEGQLEARAVAVASSEHLGRYIEQLAAPLRESKISKKEIDQVQEVLEYNAKTDTGGRSFLYHDINDLLDHWQDTYGTIPTEAQIDAYFTAVQISDFEFVLRNADVYTQKAKLGYEQFSFKISNGQEMIDFPAELSGRIVNDFPAPNPNSPYRVAVIQNGAVSKSYYSRNVFQKDVLETMRALKDDGYSLIQTSGFKVGDTPYQYILIRDFKRNRLKIDQLPYNPGHRIHEHGHYIAQPKIKTNEDGYVSYTGVTNYGNIRSEKEGRELADLYSRALKMHADKDPNWQQFVRDNLPISPERFAKEIESGALNPAVPMFYKRRGGNLLGEVRDRFGPDKVDDFTSYEHDPSNQITGRFLGEKDEEHLPTFESERDHTFKSIGSRYLKPLEALKVGMKNTVNLRVMNDYRQRSLNDFVRNFKDIIDGTSAEFRSEGLDFLYNPKYNSTADPTRVIQAERMRHAIVDLLGQKTWGERAVEIQKERIIGSMAWKWGNDNKAVLASDRALHTIEHAPTWLRATAFYSKLGMWNPKHLFLQASSAVNAVFIGGAEHGWRGINASFGLWRAGLTSDLAKIKETHKLAVGWKQDEYLELVDSWKRSGFAHVGNDTAFLDMATGPAIRKGKFKNILDHGSVFFNRGELYARSMGYGVAFSEWKKANKGMKLTREGEATILRRAKLLAGNMTRENNARWQKGYLSTVTQFMGAQARMTEMLLGPGLNLGEKARLATSMSIMYGLPVGVGGFVGVLPVRDMLKDWLATNNVQYDNTIAEPFIDGFAAALLENVFHLGDYNIADKFGLGGIPTFYDLIKQDTSITDLLLGASGGVMWDTFVDTNPAWWMIGAQLDLNDQTAYPVTPSDLVDVLRNVQSVNNAVKVWETLNTQTWMSQNGIPLTDATWQEAAFGALLGADVERISDTYNKIDANQAIDAARSDTKKEIEKQLIKAIQAIKFYDGANHDAFVIRAKALAIKLGISPGSREWYQLWQKAYDKEPLDQVIMDEYGKRMKKLTGAQ